MAKEEGDIVGVALYPANQLQKRCIKLVFVYAPSEMH